MAISTGTHLGHYEILSLLGAGGMGEVYRAHDTKLKREVALKVLPDNFARDPERLARFRREAQLLASLNHTNIATIHGLEEANGTHFLVMELVLGGDIRERILREGAVPVEESLTIAGQIAEALEHAHENGVIHRDLKPANVKVTPEGNVKVLDFGLAKAFAGDSGAGDSPKHVLDSDSPTLTSPTALMASPTLPGVILGTAAYMSPEQARGKTVDKRTDIWAMGCVLYELLSGKQAFAGENVTEILAAVLKAEPDWNALPETTPSNIRFLLRRCLQKDSKRRFRDAADVRIEIEEARAAPAVAPALVSGPHPFWRGLLPWAAAVVLSAIIGIAVWNWKPAPPPVERPISRFAMTLPAGDRLVPELIALSPDGARLVYIASHNGTQQLFLRDMESLEAKLIPGTEQAYSPFFSPDGQWIGFFTSLGKLKKVSIVGGAPLTICDVGAVHGATWGSDDTIFFTPTSGNVGISKVPAAGGTPQPVTAVDVKKGELNHSWPEVLPGGTSLLFAVASRASPDSWQIAAQSLQTGERRVLVQGGTYPHYSSSGHLLFYRAGTVMAVPFDPVRLEVKGTPAPVLEGVMPTPGCSGAANFITSRNGSIAYVPGGSTSNRTHARLGRPQGSSATIAGATAPLRPSATLT